jgi:hypothetical protein
MRLTPLAQASGFPLVFLQTPALAGEGGLYLSAGIHGDEPAGSEGLLAWAESNLGHLREIPALIFPCLNPWGLAQNTRGDAGGNDLNRSFHRRLPIIRAVQRAVGKRRFAAAVHLHEDFDGEGLYLYELTRRARWGEALLEATPSSMQIDPRKRIDRWKATDGIIYPRVRRERYTRLGFPEALWLYFGHTDRALTIETPSEFALEDRVAAQVAMLNEIVCRVVH